VPTALVPSAISATEEYAMPEGRTKARRFELGIARDVVSPVIDALRALGFDAAAEVSNLEASADSVVPGALADRLLDAAAAKLDREDLWIEIARRVPIAALGLLDYALCTSATLRDALERVSVHYGLLTQRVGLRLVESKTTAALVLERAKGITHSRHWIEFSFGALAERARQTMAREMVFEEVSFVHEAPTKPSSHEAFFGRPVLWNQPEDRLVFARSLLDQRLLTASTALGDLLDVKIRELEKKESSDAFVERARAEMILLLDEGDVKLDTLATRLRLTRRTLQRELARRKLSHKELLDDIRKERASALLGEALTVNEVSERLGYSEPSAFFRAYRRWTGTSPRAGR
jgi:AraC-like DNA-binding protein